MAKAPEPILINGPKELEAFLKIGKKVSFVIFTEDWSDNCTMAYDSLLEIVTDSEVSNEDIGVGKILAESNPEICQSYKVTGVPTIVLFQGMKEVHRVIGVRVRELATKLSFYALNQEISVEIAPAPKPVDLKERIEKLLKQSDVMLFMKGTTNEPQCGFSRTIVGILNESGVPYSTFNILADNEIREGLKAYSNWVTYPQLYVKGQLIGGLDIIKELKDSGDLMDTLKA